MEYPGIFACGKNAPAIRFLRKRKGKRMKTHFWYFTALCLGSRGTKDKRQGQNGQSIISIIVSS